jgi:FkbM family methyltransferase
MAFVPKWLALEVEEYFVARDKMIDIHPEIVLDIGANIGIFAIRAHKEWPQAKVICYEPLPSNVGHLRKNTDAQWSQLESHEDFIQRDLVQPDFPWCQVEPYAVRGTAGEAEMFYGNRFVTSGFIKTERTLEETVRVKCVAAGSLPSCEVVKIDTEGCELEILPNLDLTKTRVVMLEHHSLADALAIKEILIPRFQLVHDETEREIGTEIYTR